MRGWGVLKNEGVLISQEQDVSGIEEANKIKEPFRAIEQNVQKSEKGKKIIGMS